MKSVLMIAVLLAPAVSWAQVPCATNMASNKLIDDFTTGQGPVLPASPPFSGSNTWLPNVTQVGDSAHVMGGLRGFQAQVTANYLGQPIAAAVVNNTSPTFPGAALALTAGVRQGFGLYPIYGLDAARGVATPLGLQFAGGSSSLCDRVRFTFDSNLAGLHVVAQLRTRDSAIYTGGISIGPQPSNAAPFCLDVPFTALSSVSGAFAPSSKAVDMIYLQLTSGNAAFGDSFAVSKIEFADGSLAASSPCLYVAK
jgi:hypothetical protein